MSGYKDLLKAVKGITRNGVLTPHLDAHLLGQNYEREETEGFIHPSSVPDLDHVCPRALALEVFTPMKKWPADRRLVTHDPQLYRIFGNGTFVHRRYQEYFIEMGFCDPRVRHGWEIPIESKKFRTRGHADAIIYPDSFQKNKVKLNRAGLANGELPISTPDGGCEYSVWNEKGKSWTSRGVFELLGDKARTRMWKPQGNPVLVEIKSMNDFTWSSCTRPKPAHVVQANIYAGFLKQQHPNLDRILWVYENKNDQTIKEFVSPLNTALFDRYCEIAERVALSPDKDLPARICKDKLSERAEKCEWASLCFSTNTFKQLVQIEGTSNGRKKISA